MRVDTIVGLLLCVLNQPPVLPLNRSALWALSNRFSMTPMMLALMLYFLIVAHKALCHTLSKAFLKSMKAFSRDSADAAGIARRLNICFVVLLPALKPACSSATSAMISSACGWSLG